MTFSDECDGVMAVAQVFGKRAAVDVVVNEARECDLLELDVLKKIAKSAALPCHVQVNRYVRAWGDGKLIHTFHQELVIKTRADYGP